MSDQFSVLTVGNNKILADRNFLIITDSDYKGFRGGRESPIGAAYL
ncbi:Uncharacterized protein dnm_017120 [Desulfonema magnum]|uniref:Uncharacterized protein n=1 Tax=Desulfonema magnum TaxID=45655 RepID=A0A975BI12_9BACT|nr:Uncharacterized protein dnm_017120 [Desulfonema magnum]